MGRALFTSSFFPSKHAFMSMYRKRFLFIALCLIATTMVGVLVIFALIGRPLIIDKVIDEGGLYLPQEGDAKTPTWIVEQLENTAKAVQHLSSTKQRETIYAACLALVNTGNVYPCRSWYFDPTVTSPGPTLQSADATGTSIPRMTSVAATVRAACTAIYDASGGKEICYDRRQYLPVNTHTPTRATH
jgi:hypothetical protein